MGSSEPSLVPEWLKSNGSANGVGRTGHHSASSTLHTDAGSLAIFSRNKSFRRIGESDSPHTLLNRSSSSNSRSSSGINNVSSKHAYSSFSKSHRDREKDRSAFDVWDRDGFATSGKDSLRRSHSMISRKQEILLPRRGVSEFTNNDKNNPYRNGFRNEDGVSKSVKKADFEKQFPIIPVNEKQAVSDIARVVSPVLTVTAQGLPIGSSALNREGWSALAEVPGVVGAANVGFPHAHQPPPEASSACRASSPDCGLNMAEALAQSPVTTRTAPQVSTEAQKLEQMAVKQSRQLIPMIPSHSSGSAHMASQSPRGTQIMPESVKTSQAGKFHVLKPPWENSASPVVKDCSALTNDVGNIRLDALASSAVSSAPSRTSRSSRAAIVERKAAASNLNAPSAVDKKRMLSHAQSRNEFFNSVRKKTWMSNSTCSEASPATSVPIDQSSEVVEERTIATLSSNGVANGLSYSNGGAHEDYNNSSTRENSSFPTTEEVIPDEEEAAFLRSLGWEENGSEDDGLTEEEINTFYQEYPKMSLLHGFHIGGHSSRLASLNSVLKFKLDCPPSAGQK
uniref:Uncharacterized protein n=1 Tax=Kalanchoe fedtschenkoi TaxID=63787 RepID=A0A7N0TK75_KALFE